MTDRNSYLILHNIRSVYNVGSIFRTADTAGISKIYLTGYTPTPHDRFGNKRKDFIKVSLGGEHIPWEYQKNPTKIIETLKKENTMIVALEQANNSVDYKKIDAKYPFALMVGNEVKGISPSLLAQADIIAEIPMRGKKESLNVSVALGIALFRILNL